MARYLNSRTVRGQSAELLTDYGRDERIARYERHLYGLLASMLHELERLKTRRGGEAALPPPGRDLVVAVE